MVARNDSRAVFSSPIEIKDEYGAVRQGWREEFTRWCGLHYLRGGESVMAGRLAGKQQVIMSVEADPDAMRIAPSWKAVVSDISYGRDGITYNIREMPRRTDDLLYLEFLAESGVAI